MSINTIRPSIDSGTARIIQGEAKKNPLSNSTQDDKLREAAQGFERTLLRQMLTTARATSLRGNEEQSDASKSYLEIMDDHLADMLTKGAGLGFGKKMAEQLIAQAKAGKLIGNAEIAVKPLSSPRALAVSPETLQSLQRPNGMPVKPQ
jgi:Rod binding domain-containing protein